MLRPLVVTVSFLLAPQAGPPALYTAGDPGLSPPVAVSDLPLAIPVDPLRLLVPGAVGLEATITTTGDLSDIRVVRSYDPDTDRLAVAALRRWRLRPATRDGQPAAVRGRFTYPIVAGHTAEIWATSMSVAFPPAHGTAPRLTMEVKPVYPGPARDAGITGTVRMSCVVLVDGTAAAVTVETGVEETLDRAAVEALRKWRFEPGRRDGVAVPMVIEVETAFRGG